MQVCSFSDFLKQGGSTRSDIPQPSVLCVGTTQAAVNRLPKELNALLTRNGWRVFVVKRISDYWITPEDKKANYTHAGQCIYKDRVMLISEDQNHGDSAEIFHTVEHECGHALDRLIAEPGGDYLFSDTDDFCEALRRDLTASNRKLGNEWWLKHVDGEGVPREVFANLCATCSTRHIDSAKLEQDLPRTTALVKERLKLFKIELQPDEPYCSHEIVVKVKNKVLAFTFDLPPKK